MKCLALILIFERPRGVYVVHLHNKSPNAILIVGSEDTVVATDVRSLAAIVGPSVTTGYQTRVEVDIFFNYLNRELYILPF